MEERRTFSISEVARTLGVTVSTLRSWERRYGVVAPARTEGGHRRFTEGEVERLSRFAELARRHRPSKAAKRMDAAEL